MSHADDELRQRVAQASHDLGNLIGIVLNYSVLLARQVTDPAVLADLGKIQIAAERAAEIVRALPTARIDDDPLVGA